MFCVYFWGWESFVINLWFDRIQFTVWFLNVEALFLMQNVVNVLTYSWRWSLSYRNQSKLNQWTGSYMMRTTVVIELTHFRVIWVFLYLQKTTDDHWFSDVFEREGVEKGINNLIRVKIGIWNYVLKFTNILNVSVHRWIHNSYVVHRQQRLTKQCSNRLPRINHATRKTV